MLTSLHPHLFVQRVPYRASGVQILRQLVIVRLPDGGLWIHSPIPWSAELRAAVRGLGEVRHVVGPNRYHDECLASFQAEYPDALFHAAPGLAESRRDVRFVPEPLGDTPHPDWAPVLDQHLVKGMPRLNEVIFLHRPSRTLILADLALNVTGGVPATTRWLLRLVGGWGRFGPSRFCRSCMRDRVAVRRSLDHVLTWDFDRVLVGHGDNLTQGGPAALRSAFAFLPAAPANVPGEPGPRRR